MAAGLLQEELLVVWLDAQGLLENPDGFYHVLELDFELGQLNVSINESWIFFDKVEELNMR